MAEGRRSPLRVLVTGIGGGGHGEQILKALRLGTLDYFVVGTDVTAACANRHEVEVFERLPPARDEAYVDALIDLAKRQACRAVFHGSEPEMMVLSREKARLEREGLFVPVNPPRVLALCQDKAQTQRHLETNGFRVPAQREIRAIGDLSGFEALPAIVKPSVGGGGSADVFIAQTGEELALFARYLLEVHQRFVVQEYVGTPDQEYTVGVLFAADGELINSIAIKRLINNALTTRMRLVNRSGRADLGDWLVVSSGISQGLVGDWPEIRRQCEAIAACLAPRAPVNIQCRWVDGQVMPFEINARYSGTTSLRAMMGYNEPEALLKRHVLGEPDPKNFPYRKGLILRSLKESLIEPPA